MANEYTPQQIEEILQMFFDVAGTRQYIGARYVPIFGRGRGTPIEWDNSDAYEPLSIVYFQGDTYTSRRYVPAGISIDNQDYWVITGRYNAQVEQYRQEVLSFQGQIDDTNEAIATLRNEVADEYVPFPDPDHYPKLGVLGQVLSTLADGKTKWEDPVTVDAAIAEPLIEAWLDDHPEATTTVQDGAITYAKLASELQNTIITQGLTAGTDLNSITGVGFYRLAVSNTYVHEPVSGGRRLLIVYGTKLTQETTISSPYQILIQMNTGQVYTRCYHDGSYDPWAQLVTGANSVGTNELKSECVTYDKLSTELKNTIINKSLTNGTDLNDVTGVGIYRMGAGSTYPNQPIAGGRRLLIVSSLTLNQETSSGSPYQIFIQFNTGIVYTRMYHDGVYDPWIGVNDQTARMIALGTNPYRKAIDHGGFFNTKYGNKSIYQNSPLSFVTSMEQGIMFHNLDICFTSDGVPVVSHNINVEDAEGVTININNTTLAQLKTHMFGDAAYSWIPQTLAECNAFIKSIGGTIDMVDISSANTETQLLHTGALPTYYRQHNIKPTWTNTDHDTHREAFQLDGPEFGTYFVCNSQASISAALSYVENHPNFKYCMNVGYSNATTAEAFDSVLEDAVDAGITIYVYTYNSSNMANVPDFADGVVSENANANYWQWLRNMVI